MKKSLVLCASSAFLGAITFGVYSSLIGPSLPTFPGYAAEEEGYTLNLNKAMDVENTWGTYVKGNGSTFNFYIWDYVGGETSFGSFEAGGGFYNATAIHSIQSVTITMTSGNVNVYTGWKDNSGDFHFASSIAGFAYGGTTKTIDLSSTLPSYVKFDVTEDANITSIKINYSCEPSTVNSSFTLVADAPVIGESDALADYNYLWVNSNLDDENWSTHLMKKREDGKWTYTFTDINVDTDYSNGYKFSLVLGSKTAANWDYKATYQNVGVLSYEGQTEFYATGNEVKFSSQPDPVLYDEYTLNLTIVVSGDHPNMSYLGIKYYDGENKWIDISSESKDIYIFEFPTSLDADSNFGFELVTYDSATDKTTSIAADTNWTWFSVVPTKQFETEHVTIEFDYSDTAEVVGGTFTQQTASLMAFPSKEISVIEDKVTLDPLFATSRENFTYSFDGDDIRIDSNNVITGLKGGTTTKVTLNSKTSSKTSFFFVHVRGEAYQETEEGDGFTIDSVKASTTEGWWVDHSQPTIAGLTSSYWNGVDVSSSYALYQNGAHFYNEEGVEESLYRILKNAGVNYVRIRLWVKPETDGGVSYGGGKNDIDTALWLANEAKAEGMKVLLDLHYSDFWADPGHQILPKDWGSLTGNSLLSKITSYTTETLDTFIDAGLTPDMVQLGNEISSGVMKQKFTGVDSVDEYGESAYFSASSFSSGITVAQFVHAASEGVKAASNSIKCVVHWTKGGSGVTYAAINSFFNGLSSSDYDYAGLSIYPYNCFDTMSEASTLFTGISIGHPWFVAETSYPFSGSTHVGDLTSFVYNNENKGEKSLANVSGYGFDALGQAKVIHDMTSSIVSAGGLGSFYWEPAWIPNANVGWAGEGSRCVWSNQGLFSYDGKVMTNLGLIQSMIPNS